MSTAELATVTKYVTDTMATEARPVKREDVIDLDTVRVERTKDFEI
ncbi:hypothetical protein [Amycolatopsis sp. NPDC051061]